MLEKEIIDNIFAKYEDNTFAKHNGIILKDVERDCAQAYMDVGPDSCNPYGLVHGGAYYTLADMCCGSACRSDGREYVTQNSSTNFIKSVKEGTITAEARVVHRGRHVCLTQTSIHDDKGKLVFEGMFTFFCISE